MVSVRSAKQKEKLNEPETADVSSTYVTSTTVSTTVSGSGSTSSSSAASGSEESETSPGSTEACEEKEEENGEVNEEVKGEVNEEANEKVNEEVNEKVNEEVNLIQNSGSGSGSKGSRSAASGSEESEKSSSTDICEDNEEENGEEIKEVNEEVDVEEDLSENSSTSTISAEYFNPTENPRATGLHKFNSDTLVGTILHIGEGSIFWRTNGKLDEKFDSPQTIRLVDVSVCYVSDLTDSQVPSFKSPELVTNLTFDGMISQENFNKLVNPCINLRSLGIHLSSFATLDFRQGRNSMGSFPNVENLVVSSIKLEKEQARSLDMNVVVENIIEFLGFQFPKLIFLSVSCPMVAGLEDKYTKALFSCMIRQKNTLQYLNLESLFKVNSAFFNGYDDENEQCSPADQDKEFPPITYDVTAANGVKLKSFHLYLVYPTGSTELWRNFLLTQKQMEYCQFWCENQPYPFYPFIAGIVRQNIKTLRTFACNVEQMEAKSIDFSVFKDSKLSTLVLKGIHIMGEVYSSSPNLTNLELLPKCIHYIKILHLSISQSDLSYISRKLPELRSLYLEDVGEQDGLGLSFKDLSYLLQKRASNTLQSLHVVHSLNRESVEEDCSVSKNYNSEDDGYRILAKILLKSLKDVEFQAELNEEGEFDSIETSPRKKSNKHAEGDLFDGMDEDDDCQDEDADSDSCEVLYDNCNHNPYRNFFGNNTSQYDSDGGFQHDECMQAENFDEYQPEQNQYVDECLEPINCSNEPVDQGTETCQMDFYNRADDCQMEDHECCPDHSNRTEGCQMEEDEYCPDHHRMRPVHRHHRCDIPHCDYHQQRQFHCRVRRYISCGDSPSRSYCSIEDYHHHNNYQCPYRSHQQPDTRRCQNQQRRYSNQHHRSNNQRTCRINVPETIHENMCEHDDDEYYDDDDEPCP